MASSASERGQGADPLGDRRSPGALAYSVAAHAALLGALAWTLRNHPVRLDLFPPVRAPEIEFTLSPPRAAPVAELVTVVRPVAPPPASAPTPPDEARSPVEPSAVAINARTPRESALAHLSRPTRIEPAPVVPIAPETAGGPSSTAPAAPAAPAAPPRVLPYTPEAVVSSRPSGITGLDLVAHADEDATRVASRGGNGMDGVAPGGPSPVAQAREASEGYLRERARAAFPSQIPGSDRYYNELRSNMAAVWRPGRVPQPSELDAIANNIVVPTHVSQDIVRRSLGPNADGRYYAAGAALDAAHPHSPMLQPAVTPTAMAMATARITRAEIEIDQADGGAVVNARVIQTSGVVGFDREAIRAATEAAGRLPPRAMPHGWTSRWSFEVSVERDPVITAAPGLPGATPIPVVTAGGEFDESTRRGTMRVPLMLHRHERIRLVLSYPTASARTELAGPRNTAH